VKSLLVSLVASMGAIVLQNLGRTVWCEWNQWNDWVDPEVKF